MGIEVYASRMMQGFDTEDYPWYAERQPNVMCAFSTLVSDYFPSLEVVYRVSKTQLQVSENPNFIYTFSRNIRTK